MRINSGILKGKSIAVAKNTKIRPTSSLLKKRIFDMLAGEIEGSLFLDICAGTGLVGIEALSRGAAHCTFIESSFSTVKELSKNLERLHIENRAKVFCMDARLALKKLAKEKATFDFIYLDPPYPLKELSLELLTFLDTHPLLTKKGLLFFEEGKDFSVDIEKQSFHHLCIQHSRPNGAAILHTLSL